MPLSKPVPRPQIAKRTAGGDNEVERDGLDRPLIIQPCDVCPGTGQVPSTSTAAHRVGKFNKCQRCKGEGIRKVAHSRVTTFIDVLDDKDNLTTYEGRMVLIGVARDPSFLEGVTDLDPEDSEDKKTLNRKAEAAKEFAGANIKSERGTRYHGLLELADMGEPLPPDVTEQERIDVMSQVALTKPLFDTVLMEQLMVCSEYKMAGTPDRVFTPKAGVVLIAPDGSSIGEGDKIIGDTKTGRTDYGALKMSMQLGTYANSKLYNKQTGEQTDIEGLRKDWGIVMHTPLDKGVSYLYWVDLTLGWEAVALAKLVREMRSRGKHALTLMAPAAASMAA